MNKYINNIILKYKYNFIDKIKLKNKIINPIIILSNIINSFNNKLKIHFICNLKYNCLTSNLKYKNITPILVKLFNNKFQLYFNNLYNNTISISNKTKNIIKNLIKSQINKLIYVSNNLLLRNMHKSLNIYNFSYKILTILTKYNTLNKKYVLNIITKIKLNQYLLLFNLINKYYNNKIFYAYNKLILNKLNYYKKYYLLTILKHIFHNGIKKVFISIINKKNIL